ncbi:MAG: restriction endonuclease [Oscillospiraceae bacterium]|nr:restriction endonuclease [Oscillospiraceae bacterium]
MKNNIHTKGGYEVYTVPISDYPSAKDWSEKIHSTPSIPGGKNVVVSNLKKLLLAVQNNAPLDQVPQLEESNSKSTLNQLCIHQLSPMNFVERSSDGKWLLTKCAKKWIESEDELYLAAYFCANVKFFAEILFYLDSPKTSRELFNIAVNEYDMAWKITTTINNRLVWLRQFGLIEFQEFSLLYSITDKGKAFIKTVNPIMPESISHSGDETLSEDELVLDEQFITYFRENKTSVRKVGFGYIPGKINEFENTLSDFLTQINKDNKIESINSYALKKYNIKDSSTRSALNTISAMGLIVRKTNTSYAITDLGSYWMESQEFLSLLPLFQLKYLFFFEILTELKDSTLSAKELATLAKVSYGFDKDNVFEINNRIAILKQAKLIINLSAERFTLTNRGKLFLEKYGNTFGIEKPEVNTNGTAAVDNIDIVSELRMASKDSYNPDRFEKVVKDFFSLIGFDAEWLGGAGKTDVLLKSTGSPLDYYVVTVDAKATSSSAVTDGLVDFDTLKEHQKKHGSNYIAVVGRDFNERLIRRATEHHVVLFDIDTLEEFLNIHQKTPQKIATYRKVFEQSGKADLSILDADIRKAESSCSLLIGIMQCLIDESEDPITKGQLSVRDLYMTLRRNPNLVSTPTINEIEIALHFLSSPIIGCVAKEKDFYYATASLKDMARILNFLREKCC